MSEREWTVYKSFVAFLLLIIGITMAVFGQALENNPLLYVGMFITVVGIVGFLIAKILMLFWRR